MKGNRIALNLAAAAGLLGALQAPLAAAQADGPILEEVVVTASKRAESVQDISFAVSALDQDSIERQQFADLKDISFSVPNLIVFNNQTTVNSVAPYIRGIGQDDSTPVQEQGVAIYVDDVYMARSQGALLDLLDFERVEVLRGPQGTLYGRNSSGGAVRFITRKPPLEENLLVGKVIYGDLNRLDIGLSAGAPLAAGKAGIKFDGIHRKRDGHMTRRSDGADVNRIDRQAGRLALRLAPDEAWMLDLAVDATRDRSGMQAPAPIGPAPGGKLAGGYAPLFGSVYVTDADAEDRNEFDGWGASATIRWRRESGELKSVTAYREFDNSFGSDLGGRTGNLDLFREMQHRQVTQEIQYVSPELGRFSYVAGLFFMSEEFDLLDLFLFSHDYTQTTKSYAAYGEATVSLSERWSLSLGGRWTKDDKKIDEDGVGLGGAFSVRGLGRDWTDFSPKAALKFQVSDQAMMYVSAQEGYKAGAFQGFPQRLTDLTEEILAPELVRAYEIGAKTEWAEGRVMANAAYFFSDYDQKQINAFNPATLGFVARSLDAEIRGLELEIAAQVAEGLRIFGLLGTLNAKVTNSDLSDPLVPPKGTRLPFVPEVHIKAGLNWERQLAGGGRLFLDASIAWKDKSYFAIFNEPFAAQPAHELIDARAGYRTADDRIEIAVGGRNLTDQAWAYTAAVIDGGTLWMSDPRTWSASFRFSL